MNLSRIAAKSGNIRAGGSVVAGTSNKHEAAATAESRYSEPMRDNSTSVAEDGSSSSFSRYSGSGPDTTESSSWVWIFRSRASAYSESIR